MLAKLTAKNQLTLPKSVTSAIGPTEYFEVKVGRRWTTIPKEKVVSLFTV